MEPFQTFRLFPLRFIIGIPIIMLFCISLGLYLLSIDFSLAIGLQIGLQTAGFMWLYIPAKREAISH